MMNIVFASFSLMFLVPRPSPDLPSQRLPRNCQVYIKYEVIPRLCLGLRWKQSSVLTIGAPCMMSLIQSARRTAKYRSLNADFLYVICQAKGAPYSGIRVRPSLNISPLKCDACRPTVWHHENQPQLGKIAIKTLPALSYVRIFPKQLLQVQVDLDKECWSSSS